MWTVAEVERQLGGAWVPGQHDGSELPSQPLTTSFGLLHEELTNHLV